MSEIILALLILWNFVGAFTLNASRLDRDEVSNSKFMLALSLCVPLVSLVLVICFTFTKVVYLLASLLDKVMIKEKGDE